MVAPRVHSNFAASFQPPPPHFQKCSVGPVANYSFVVFTFPFLFTRKVGMNFQFGSERIGTENG